MPIDISTSLKYYKQPEVQEAIVKSAEGKEIGVLFQGSFFGKRPDILKYPKDVLEFAKNGASSFHCSEETWSNPLQLNSNLKRNELDELRSGWDLIIDIDSKILDYSKIAADLVVQALRYYDIDSLSTKFSGNHGFHIAIPFEAFPETVNEQKVKNLFPEGPRRIASHLKRMILPFLTKTLLDKESIDEIMKKTGLKKEELTVNGKFDPFSFVGIDTILISSRHLFRMPYSLNEKSGLVSIPIKPEKILEFNKDEEANPKNILFERNFMNRELARPGEARKLFIQSFDETVEVDPIVKNEIKEFVGSATAVPEQYFPPCIKLILQGLKDGKKRSVFTLTNFLTCNGWGYDDIQKLMTDWNKKNPEPLREVIIQGHLKYHKKQNKKILPPNCSNKAYYSDLGICQPDSFCQKITNPANYSILRQKIVSENKPVRKKKVEKKESVENKEKLSSEITTK